MNKINNIEIPLAFIDKTMTTENALRRMLKNNEELYDKISTTIGFAYEFNQIANKAFHFDFLQAAGIIPKNYPENCE